MARIRKILLAVFLLCNISAIGQVSIKDYEHDENWYVLPEDSKYSLNNFVEFYKNFIIKIRFICYRHNGFRQTINRFKHSSL